MYSPKPRICINFQPACVNKNAGQLKRWNHETQTVARAVRNYPTEAASVVSNISIIKRFAEYEKYVWQKTTTNRTYTNHV
jgi:hypothetical protein